MVATKTTNSNHSAGPTSLNGQIKTSVPEKPVGGVGRRTLHAITDDLLALERILIESEGDIGAPGSETEQAVEAWLGELKTDLTAKADNYAALITELQKRSAARSSEAQRMAALAKRDQAAADWLKFRLKVTLGTLNIDKVEGPRFRITVCGNGGAQPVDIHEPGAVPKAYCRFIPEQREPDVDLIRDALLAGKKVPGAILQERGTHLRIA